MRRADATGPAESPDKDLLRLLTCGSVDDGKSTLIGRLLFDHGRIPDDHLEALARDSRRFGTTGEAADLALLMDGLEAEREQGITIDVAYRFFETPRRSFIIADAPGHEQYTRNMATAASNADLALILVDAEKGVRVQTRRHAAIASLMGIRRVVLAVNKMDRLGFAPEPFERVVAAFAAFAARLQFEAIAAIPISARDGDNVARPSPRTPWYAGPTLIAHLEGVDAAGGLAAQPMRFPVQWVNRPDAGFRGLAGTVVSGALEAGAEVAVAPSGAVTRVARIVTAEGDRARAEAGEAVTLVLTDELDVARGDLIAPARARPAVADQFAAHLVWLGREALLPGRGYEMRIGTRWTRASVSLLKHKLSVDDLDELAARTLVTNEIGFANLAVATPVAFDPYAENRDTGAFILVDRVTNETVAAGMIAHALRRASNIHHEALALDKAARSALKHQRATVLWFTGLPASGKSTVAKLVEAQLAKSGQHTMMLDGDNLRHGLNRDLGFTDADRVENVRRVGEVAKLMTEAGLIVLCAFISPFRAERRMVREMFDAGEFLEIFVDAPLEACIARDPKGLYAKARAGQIPHFTGIDSPYEAPEAPDLILDTSGDTAEESAGRVMDLLRARARILG